jgi:hypothetical protein
VRRRVRSASGTARAEAAEFTIQSTRPWPVGGDPSRELRPNRRASARRGWAPNQPGISDMTRVRDGFQFSVSRSSRAGIKTLWRSPTRRIQNLLRD